MEKSIDGISKTQTPKYTVDIQHIPPLSEEEIKADIKIPYFKFTAEGATSNEKIVDESNRVASEVLRYLRVPLERYRVGISPFNLIDVESQNDNGHLTLPRTEFGKENMDLPVIIYTAQSIIDKDGNHSVAMWDPNNNIVALDTSNLKRQLTEKHSRTITKPGDVVLKPEVLDHPEVIAGITMIEEMTHFVQFQFWKEDPAGKTNSDQSIEDHDADPFEAEARIIKNQLIKFIYPGYVLREVQADRKIELEYEVKEACENAMGTESKVRVCDVYVEDLKYFPILINLALKGILMTNYGLSNDDLDSDEYQKYYKEWYESNTEQHLNYVIKQTKKAEESQHVAKFGMEFAKDDDGKINCNPYIEFEDLKPNTIDNSK